MRIQWQVPFSEEIPEAVQDRILERLQNRWQRMLESQDPSVRIHLSRGSDMDPQEPDFEGLSGKKKEQDQLRQRLHAAAVEIFQMEIAKAMPAMGGEEGESLEM
jgi:hypothetical protein